MAVGEAYVLVAEVDLPPGCDVDGVQSAFRRAGDNLGSESCVPAAVTTAAGDIREGTYPHGRGRGRKPFTMVSLPSWHAGALAARWR